MTAKKGTTPDAGDTIGDRDARQVGAFIEGLTPDGGNAIWNRDARQAAAVEEAAPPCSGPPKLGRGECWLLGLTQDQE